MTTHLTRRRFHLAVAAALATPAAFAQDWPAKPIRIIVPYPPGGFTDTTARLVGPDPLHRSLDMIERSFAGDGELRT